MLQTILTIFIFTSCLITEYSHGARDKFIPKWKRQACEFPLSNNDQSHYICDDKGEVKCLPGWQGDICDVPICRRGCDPMNGYCKRPGECRCKLGFYGEKCNKCIPLPGCQHGHCNSSFECICSKGWDGLFCSEPICRKECHSTRGYCEMPGECRCRLGWSGPTCHDCQVLPGCQYGTCTKPLECKCNSGYTGILCQTPICASKCHRQHGYCRRPGECRCKVGWTGNNCAQCHPYPGCVNGDCRKPWECNCQPGWGGILCDEKLNYCELNPDTCENDAHCISRIKDDGSFRCMCPRGYRGKRCEILPPDMLSLTNVTQTILSPIKPTTPMTTTLESIYVIKPIPLSSSNIINSNENVTMIFPINGNKTTIEMATTTTTGTGTTTSTTTTTTGKTTTFTTTTSQPETTKRIEIQIENDNNKLIDLSLEDQIDNEA